MKLPIRSKIAEIKRLLISKKLKSLVIFSKLSVMAFSSKSAI